MKENQGVPLIALDLNQGGEVRGCKRVLPQSKLKVTPVEKNQSYYEPYKGQDGAWLDKHEGGMGWALDTWE